MTGYRVVAKASTSAGIGGETKSLARWGFGKRRGFRETVRLAAGMYEGENWEGDWVATSPSFYPPMGFGVCRF
jgi:hypothetical protein